jgi:hypothetical protein
MTLKERAELLNEMLRGSGDDQAEWLMRRGVPRSGSEVLALARQSSKEEAEAERVRLIMQAFREVIEACAQAVAPLHACGIGCDHCFFAARVRALIGDRVVPA